MLWIISSDWSWRQHQGEDGRDSARGRRGTASGRGRRRSRPTRSKAGPPGASFQHTGFHAHVSWGIKCSMKPRIPLPLTLDPRARPLFRRSGGSRRDCEPRTDRSDERTARGRRAAEQEMPLGHRCVRCAPHAIRAGSVGSAAALRQKGGGPLLGLFCTRKLRGPSAELVAKARRRSSGAGGGFTSRLRSIARLSAFGGISLVGPTKREMNS